jgi:hypothetical protein
MLPFGPGFAKLIFHECEKSISHVVHGILLL